MTSWNFTDYDDTMATSNLNHEFELSDLNEYCTVHVTCIAKNHHGKSEHHFNLSLNNSETHCVLPSTVSTIHSTDGEDNNILKIVLPTVLSAVTLALALVICVALTVCIKKR